MKPKVEGKQALLVLGVAVFAAFSSLLSQINHGNMADFLGALVGVSLALWAISGISIMLSKPDTAFRNWMITVSVLGFFHWYGSMS